METVLEFKNKEKQRNLEVSEKVALQESWPCVESCKTGRDCDWQGWGGQENTRHYRKKRGAISQESLLRPRMVMMWSVKDREEKCDSSKV